jgi:hypothetical protein
MSEPAQHLLVIRAGDTETVSVVLEDADGNPINIAGRTYSAQIRATADAANPLATFTCSIVDAAAGRFACTLSATTTAALSAGGGVWDLQESYGSPATVSTLLAGTVRIDRDVTR